MAILRCKMCGGDLVLTPDSTVAECEYCGTVQTVPTVDNEKKLSLFNRAHRLRRLCEFDKAAGVYEQIVAEFPEEAEAYWGLVLCDYGIEYVDDPADGKKIPTCHRSSYASVMENKDYSLALEYADASARKLYRQEAKQIEELRKGILSVSGKEAPYDIFICYKETDDAGNRTLDSVLAQDIYNALTEKGFRVFFSRVSLEDKLGQEYEPYIFAALNSARIMLVVGTDYERFQAVWVKNEWSRFLKLMETDKNRYLIPCFRDIDAYDMPSEFARFQAQDLGKMGAIQDILRGVEKLLPKKKQVTVIQERVVLSENPNTAPLLRRAALFLEDRDWDSADKYCEKVLDMEPENGDAYFIKLMAEYHISREGEQERIDPACLNSANYQKALRFGDEALQEKLEGIRKDTVYHAAKKLAARKEGQQKANFREAIAQLQTIPGWRDSVQLIEKYRSSIREIEAREEAQQQEQLRKEQQERQQQAERRRQAEEKRKREQKKAAEFGHKLKIILTVVCAVLILAILVNTVVAPMLSGKQEKAEKRESISIFAGQETAVPENTQALTPEEIAYTEAETLLANGETAKAAIAFGKLGDYSDARERSIALWNEVAVRDTVITSCGNTIGVKKDGTVLYAGTNEHGWANAKKDLKSWTDIIAIDSGDGWSGYVVGLKSDGTVTAVNGYFSEVKNWQDIVSVSAAPGCALGLKMDGTVEAIIESNNPDYFTWVQEIAEWTDIITVRAHWLYAMGLRSDGTVVIAGNRAYKPILQIQEEVKKWHDIVAIGTGKNHNSHHVMGLKSDGTVVCAGNNFFEQCDVTDWTDIVKIRTCRTHTVGIRSDGTLVTAGSNRDGGISVGPEKPEWDSVVDVSVYDYYTVGIRSDGTVVGTGNKNYGKLNIQDWSDIALPGELKMPG